MPSAKQPKGKELLAALRARGFVDFGSVIPGTLVQQVLGIEYPARGARSTFERLRLIEVAAIDYVRAHLLEDGMYLAAQGGDYRILLPSENARQCARYMEAADRKLARSIKLERNTPVGDSQRPTNDMVRAFMKREDIKSMRREVTE